jgi:alkylation response protein AidB-like acyl-CoA dehydrogenase
MCGTGSHDVEIDVFVPDERAVPLAPLEQPGPAYEGPMAKLSIWPAVGATAAPALGIARAAIDELVKLATPKTPMYTAKTLRERSVVQVQVAGAEAKLAAARAFFYAMWDELWKLANGGRSLAPMDKARCQLAASHAATAAAEAVDLVHLAAGGSAIRNELPLQRHFRDAHVITQHAFISASRLEAVGQAMMGLEPDWPFFAL